MIGMNVWWVYLSPQNIPRAIVLTLGNKVGLYFSLGWVNMISTATQHTYIQATLPLLQQRLKELTNITHVETDPWIFHLNTSAGNKHFTS